jgi:hypothetical protein
MKIATVVGGRHNKQRTTEGKIRPRKKERVIKNRYGRFVDRRGRKEKIIK